MTRAVLFDLFHTLIRLRPGGDLGPPTWKTLGVPQDAWTHSFYRDDDGRATGLIRDPVESLRLVAHRINSTIPLARIERAIADRERRFEDAYMNVEPGVLRGVRRLREAGLRLALVSNAGWEEITHWERSPLAPHFDVATFSCALGVAKPAAGIYDHALAAIDVRAADAVFVGDGGSDEHRGARAVGLRPVLLTHMLLEVWPEKLAERRVHADVVLDDVEALADWLLAGEDAT